MRLGHTADILTPLCYTEVPTYMWLGAQTVSCNSNYCTAIVATFIIENHGEVKERFSYEIQFNRATRLSLIAYSKANYGPEAVFRLMTDAEKADSIAPSAQASIIIRSAVLGYLQT